MRELTIAETREVNGAVLSELAGITGVAEGLTIFSVAGALLGSYHAGYTAGTWLYNNYIGPRYVYR